MKKGFTLVEVLVALTLFSIVLAIAVGGFARALHTQGQVSSLIAAESNADATLEQIAREMRTGYLFCTTLQSTVSYPERWQSTDGSPDCNSTCTTGSDNVWTCPLLHFYNAEGNGVLYSLVNGTLMRNQTAITGDNITVAYLTFTIFGQLQGDTWNPRITVSMGVVPSSTDPAIANDVLHLQTTVSARQPDYSASTPY